jgi:uncharacterized damage-inducible protein DinB
MATMDLESLAEFPEFLAGAVETVPQSTWTTRSADGYFALVEHVWHLADLEVEGFAVRLRRLVEDDSPELPDFNGAALAAERDYLRLDLRKGLAGFVFARRDNLAILEAMREEQWSRSGTQEGVGKVTIADIPVMMVRHDAEHRGEIETLLSELRPR